MDLVSIIIPVYNTEKYIKRALESVVSQTYGNLEILCIDDCSTDTSPMILDEYAQKDSRIKVIHFNKNKGVGAARNAGLDIASGKYIMFLDSDDWFNHDAIENAYKSISSNGSDIVIFGGLLMLSDSYGIPTETLEFCEKYYRKDVNINDLDSYFISTVWNKIFRHKFLSDNNIKFVEEQSIGEDSLFCISCILNKPKVNTLPKYLHHYRIAREASIINIVKNAGLIILDSFNYFVETEQFRTVPEQCKINIINRYFEFFIKDYNRSKDKIFRFKLTIKCSSKIRYLKKWVGIKLLKKCFYYNTIIKILSDKILIKNNSSLLKKTYKRNRRPIKHFI